MSGRIKVVGLGPGSWENLTLKAVKELETAGRIVLRTEKHPVIDYLKSTGIEYEALDNFYERGETFDQVYDNIAAYLLEQSLKGDLVYCVPGNPAVAEASVELLKLEGEKRGVEVEIIPGMSFLDAIYDKLSIDPAKGLQIVDGLRIGDMNIDTAKGCIITQVYNRLVAAEVKLTLMEYYEDDHPIKVVRAAGVAGQEIVREVPLYELDRLEFIDHLTTIYVPACDKKKHGIQDLLDIMKVLRGDSGCPWDREQDHRSLMPYLLEETYEVLDAIEKKDLQLLEEELGDLLLQVVFHSQIAWEEGNFSFDEVVNGICVKLLSRHPHVFGGKRAEDSDRATERWEASKREEKGTSSYTRTLEDIPVILPSLIRSYKVQQKAALAGFDWDRIEEVMDKVKEELLELEEVYKSGKMNRIREEIGDLLFAVVNLARFEKVQPELALKETTEKFISRFRFIEENSHLIGKTLDQMSLSEMEELWQMAKVHNFNEIDKK
ncbi:MAG: Nucleoside triphosphate pyrophosphohydrolase MazG [Firmicutes bacterium]|nr:Nucleoside triphosphate pyrophosphohydrolase MazG [Bacillota bacterium]MDI6705077.1 nucleoside triphosphate pyrophosphohydrolase [Bacillota bacterium]